MYGDVWDFVTYTQGSVGYKLRNIWNKECFFSREKLGTYFSTTLFFIYMKNKFFPLFISESFYSNLTLSEVGRNETSPVKQQENIKKLWNY